VFSVDDVVKILEEHFQKRSRKNSQGRAQKWLKEMWQDHSELMKLHQSTQYDKLAKVDLTTRKKAETGMNTGPKDQNNSTNASPRRRKEANATREAAEERQQVA
jgi:hypothetical protein